MVHGASPWPGLLRDHRCRAASVSFLQRKPMERRALIGKKPRGVTKFKTKKKLSDGQVDFVPRWESGLASTDSFRRSRKNKSGADAPGARQGRRRYGKSRPDAAARSARCWLEKAGANWIEAVACKTRLAETETPPKTQGQRRMIHEAGRRQGGPA